MKSRTHRTDSYRPLVKRRTKLLSCHEGIA